MKKRDCATCETRYYSDSAIELEGKEFCSHKCLKEYYLKRIEALENSVKSWKEAWFEMRDIVGRLGSKFLIPDSYKNDGDTSLYDPFPYPYVAKIDIGNMKLTCPCYKINEEDRLIEEATAIMEKNYPDTEIDSDECKCSCHNPGKTIMHFMPCCHVCPNCKKDIKACLHKEHCNKCNKKNEVVELYELLDSNVEEE